MNSQEQLEQEIAQNNRLNELCYAALNNPQGKELLKFLYNAFVIRPVADPNENSNYAYFREGENNIIRKLKVAIDDECKIIMRGNNDRNNRNHTI